MLNYVSIHAPARGATIRLWETEDSYAVSIHAPARGATNVAAILKGLVEFQSTPPRGGRHVSVDARGTGLDVSIHAPARGATAHSGRGGRGQAVSIHAPARGATPVEQPGCHF